MNNKISYTILALVSLSALVVSIYVLVSQKAIEVPKETKETSATPETRTLDWKTYSNEKYMVSLQYPSNWNLNWAYHEDDTRYEGEDGFFMISAISGGNEPNKSSIEEVYKYEAYHKLKPYGSNPKIEVLKVDGQDARLILPSDDQPQEKLGRQAALIAKYPNPIQISGYKYRYFVLWADEAHIEGDCDTDTDCITSYCAKNVGAKYNQVAAMDVCEKKIIGEETEEGLQQKLQIETEKFKKQTKPEEGEKKLVTSVDLGQKINLLENGSTDKKIDLLFIPQNVIDFDLLESKIKDILYKANPDPNMHPISFFNTEPFKSYKNGFNIAYINKNIDEDFFKCWREEPDPNGPPKWHLGHGCDDELIKEAYKIFNPDYIIVIFDNFPPGYNSLGGEIQYLEMDLGDELGFTFIHEFGHQFGGLADEYIVTISPSYYCGGFEQEQGFNECIANYSKAVAIYPNVDTLGCPKWCENYNINKLLEENKICGQINNAEDCASHGDIGQSCTWFNFKHPWFNTNCVLAQGFENIGINCEENTQCIFGADYGQLAFDAGYGNIMDGGLKFIGPSEEHLESFLKCFHLKQESIKDQFCEDFVNKFKDLPSDILNVYLKIAYEKMITLIEPALTPVKSIMVLSPNGGEKFIRGNMRKITWQSEGVEKVNIGIYGYNSKGTIILSGGPLPGGFPSSYQLNADRGYYEWIAPSKDYLGNYPYYKIVIYDSNDSEIRDESDNYFSIIENLGLKNIENQLASIAHAVVKLKNLIKELLKIK